VGGRPGQSGRSRFLSAGADGLRRFAQAGRATGVQVIGARPWGRERRADGLWRRRSACRERHKRGPAASSRGGMRPSGIQVPLLIVDSGQSSSSDGSTPAGCLASKGSDAPTPRRIAVAVLFLAPNQDDARSRTPRLPAHPARRENENWNAPGEYVARAQSTTKGRSSVKHRGRRGDPRRNSLRQSAFHAADGDVNEQRR